MGGITFIDYVKELPKGKREAKGATKGGYATTAAKKPAAAKPAANGAASAPRGLPEASTAAAGGGGAGGEVDVIAEKIVAKVREEEKGGRRGVYSSSCHMYAFLNLEKMHPSETFSRDFCGRCCETCDRPILSLLSWQNPGSASGILPRFFVPFSRGLVGVGQGLFSEFFFFFQKAQSMYTSYWYMYATVVLFRWFGLLQPAACRRCC